MPIERPEKEKILAVIPDEYKGLRLDHTLVKMYPEYSRARLQKWIKSGDITVDGNTSRPKAVIAGGERVELKLVTEDAVYLEAEAIALDIIHEDDEIIVVNKPAGLVVHPGAGNTSGTLANALLHHLPDFRTVPRVGIVHRLDKDTTGLLVVAKDLKSQTNLVEQLQKRSVSRNYIALVHGELISGGTINDPIARHSVDRKKMAVKPTLGRQAITHYRIRKKFTGFTLLDVSLETGRTHQIRVHMSYHKYPIVGDKTYGRKINPGRNEKLSLLASFPRQALHAASLSFVHPKSQEQVLFNAPVPNDFQELIDVLMKNHES